MFCHLFPRNPVRFRDKSYAVNSLSAVNLSERSRGRHQWLWPVRFPNRATLVGLMAIPVALSGCLDASFETAVLGDDRVQGRRVLVFDRVLFDALAARDVCAASDLTLSQQSAVCRSAQNGSFDGFGGDDPRATTFQRHPDGTVTVSMAVAIRAEDMREMIAMVASGAGADPDAVRLALAGRSMVFRITGVAIVTTDGQTPAPGVAEIVLPLADVAAGAAAAPSRLTARVRF